MRARHIPIVLVLLPLLWTGVHSEQRPTAARNASLPLAVEEVGVVDRVVTVTVRNTGARTMTAWGVRAHVTFADGTTQSAVAMIEGYESGYGRRQEDRALAVEATAMGQLAPSLRNGKVTWLSVSPLAVVFDDGVAAGDEGILEMVFYARQLNREVWQFAETLVDRLLAESTDPASARAIAKRGLSGREVSDIAGRAALRRFRGQLLAGLGSVAREDLAARLRDLQDEVSARRAAADAHYRRRHP